MLTYDIPNRLSTGDAKKVFSQRAKIISGIRKYLDGLGFVEVDTPVLYPYPEIAPMEQFRAIDPTTQRQYYMRVCPTEHLKRYMIAGFDKVYEFSRNFRPGNISEKHSSEFTSLECSQIGATYRDMMILTETLVSMSVDLTKGSRFVDIGGSKFDVTPPWDRVSVRASILERTGTDVLLLQTVKSLKSQAQAAGVDVEGLESRDQIVDRLVEAVVLPHLKNPTFVTEYPYALGGPALPDPADNRVKQRCEAFIGTLEVANMSSHLNDLPRLRSWHAETLQIKKQQSVGDALLDEPLFDAVGLGFPASAVVGIGIDRLVMIATGSHSITDVIAFPFNLM